MRADVEPAEGTAARDDEWIHTLLLSLREGDCLVTKHGRPESRADVDGEPPRRISHFSVEARGQVTDPEYRKLWLRAVPAESCGSGPTRPSSEDDPAREAAASSDRQTPATTGDERAGDHSVTRRGALQTAWESFLQNSALEADAEGSSLPERFTLFIDEKAGGAYVLRDGRNQCHKVVWARTPDLAPTGLVSDLSAAAYLEKQGDIRALLDVDPNTPPTVDWENVYGIAAEEYSGEATCRGNCDRSAKWIVEVANGSTGFRSGRLLCTECATSDQVGVRRHDLHHHEVSVEARRRALKPVEEGEADD